MRACLTAAAGANLSADVSSTLPFPARARRDAGRSEGAKSRSGHKVSLWETERQIEAFGGQKGEAGVRVQISISLNDHKHERLFRALCRVTQHCFEVLSSDAMTISSSLSSASEMWWE